MSGIFLWGGLTLLVAGPVLGLNTPFQLVGGICMGIGFVLLILGK